MSIEITNFGQTSDGTEVQAVTLNKYGIFCRFLTLGAIIQDLRITMDKVENRPVVLGLNTVEDYETHSPYFGAIAGRYANRIAEGKFSLDGESYQVSRNQNDTHHLHGGFKSIGKRVWDIIGSDDTSVTFGIKLSDGEEGYPGNADIKVTYAITAEGRMEMGLVGTTDKTTLMNLALHSYFNLDASVTILDHSLTIPAKTYLPVRSDLIPTGEVVSVADTAFDFRNPRVIGTRPENDVLYDHNYCLAEQRFEEPQLAATLIGAQNLALEIYSTEPGVQFYDGHKVNIPVPGLDGTAYGAHAGLCLEPQIWPDSPNNPSFPQARLEVGETYHQKTIYQFKEIS